MSSRQLREGSVLPPHPIGQVLRTLVRWGVTTSLGMSASCSGSNDANPLDPTADDWKQVSCTPGNPNPEYLGTDAKGVDLFATAISPSQMLDYAAAYLSAPGGVGEGGLYPATVRGVGNLGSACKSATDTEACSAALQALELPDSACVDNSQCNPFLVTTQGDDVQRIDSTSDLLAWLGPIDTAAEAVLVAVWKGVTPACETTQGNLYYLGRGTQVREVDDGFEVRSEWEACGAPEAQQTLLVNRDGSTGDIATIQLRNSVCTIGRRPSGLLPSVPARDATVLGAYFATAAHLEAASVYAFQRLARELMHHEAPRPLIAWAAQSAIEEVRHTQLTAALARRFGAEPYAPHVQPIESRSLMALALENAIEGCVRETYGALVAHHQAALARDPQIAQIMTVIAADETRHAELSWHLAAWLELQLSEEQRAQLLLARTAALHELRTGLSANALPAHAARTLGLPSAETELALLEQMAHALQLA